MGSAPSPAEIFDRAVEEGNRRLDQSLLELVSTSFIAGFTIVFGIVALGIVESVVEPQFGHVAKLAGALAFGIGLVFVIVGRTELFNENFLDPTAAAVEEDGWNLWPLGRLWVLTFVFNLAGGSIFVLVFSVDGTISIGAADALTGHALEIVDGSVRGWFASGIAGGALVSLASYLLVAVDSDGSRIAIAYVVGVLLAIGPFDHSIVTILHVAFGIVFAASIDPVRIVLLAVVVTAGNLVGGLGLVTFTHIVQVMGAREE